ncbi:MAG: hypothetical protein Q8K99_01880 [Actinomycetota bacterium]|nr:hypothetical protein [Actinomycetota bacterium]
MDIRLGFSRAALAVSTGMLVIAALALCGCGKTTPGPERVDSSRESQEATVVLLPQGMPRGVAPREDALPRQMSVNRRLAERMAQYDEMYVRVEDTVPVRKTYGIDVMLPEEAAGGKLAGLWMQVPDVDGGFAWALYDTSLVEIQVWIAPSEGEAERGARSGGGPYGDEAESFEIKVDGHKAMATPRVWMPAQRIRYPGTPSYSAAGWSSAVISWAVGQCTITVSSTERDVEELVEVARAVQLSGEAHLPTPVKE